MKRVLLALALGSVVGGCDSIFGCNEKPKIYEYDYFGSDELVAAKRDLTLSFVAESERQGYECTNEPLRNAFGGVIGRRYTCTKC